MMNHSEKRENAYALLKQTILEIENGNDHELQKSAAAFKAAVECWNQLADMVRTDGFSTEREEIYFFKRIKSGCIALVEYYTRLHHALSFEPAIHDPERDFYWLNEISRIDAFLDQHANLIEYFESDRTDLDRSYFLRPAYGQTCPHPSRIYDADPKISSSHDWIISMALAFENYKRYIIKHTALQHAGIIAV